MNNIQENKCADIVKEIYKNGYTLIDNINDMSKRTNPFFIIDSDGYKYKIYWNDFKRGKHPLRFHRRNPYSIQNINNFFIKELSDEYECISSEYKNNMSLLNFVHKKCGSVFSSTWAYMKDLKDEPTRAYNRCSNCNTNKTESHHASALKQVFLREYPDTIVEEKSCVNPKTLRILPTDIVNHRLKIVVEIQSSLHDSEYKKELDKIKKNFWINKGYRFYDPDIRNYSILEMIQLFFPHIKDIPNYIDFNFSNCIDFNKVQERINKGLTIKEVAKELNLNENTVRWLVVDKKVKLPEGYNERVYHIRKIVRLTKRGDFIEIFDSLNALNRNGFANGTIRRVLNGKQDFAYDSFWVYEDDYLSGSYILPEIKKDKFMSPVDKYDMDNNFICSYDTIYNAENDSRSSRNEIWRVATGDHKSSRNEKWKFSNNNK